MNKLEELQRIIYEHYNSEELVEYYKRKILQIKKDGGSKEQIAYYAEKLRETEQKIEIKGKAK